MKEFVDKIIWITGASSGIGEALAYELAKRGARLVLSARNENELRRVRERCVSPSQHRIVSLDLEAYLDIEAKADEVWRDFGPIDILINNAGLSQRYLGIEGRVELDAKIMNINFLGTVALTRPILSHMINRNDGQIVVVSSVLGLYGIQTRTTYSASKHALRGYFESLRNEIFNSHVKITMIYPGFVKTKVSNNAICADGKSYGELDNAHAGAISADQCAEKMIEAIKRRKSSVIIGGPKELLGVWMARYAPGIFRLLSPHLQV